MNYQEFLNDIRMQIAKRIDPEAKLRIQTMQRNNGTSYEGLIILNPGRNVAPTIYLTPYYHRYLDGVCMEDIYSDILTTYELHMPRSNFDTSIFTDFAKVKSRIVMRLISASRNRGMLSEVPHFSYQDLAIVFYCLLHADDENQASILIHNDQLALWDIDADTLYQLAKSNTPRILPYQVTPMCELLREYACGSYSDGGIPMYVLSNRYRTNGATALLYEKVLSDVAEQLASNLIILPSSIHEVILIAASDASDLKRCSRMVHEVNETQLADEEVLSDHAYYYDRSTGMVSYVMH